MSLFVPVDSGWCSCWLMASGYDDASDMCQYADGLAGVLVFLIAIARYAPSPCARRAARGGRQCCTYMITLSARPQYTVQVERRSIVAMVPTVCRKWAPPLLARCVQAWKTSLSAVLRAWMTGGPANSCGSYHYSNTGVYKYMLMNLCW